MKSYHKTKDGRLVVYYLRKSYKKARYQKVEARALNWYYKTFGQERDKNGTD